MAEYANDRGCAEAGVVETTLEVIALALLTQPVFFVSARAGTRRQALNHPCVRACPTASYLFSLSLAGHLFSLTTLLLSIWNVFPSPLEICLTRLHPRPIPDRGIPFAPDALGKGGRGTSCAHGGMWRSWHIARHR